MTPSSQPDVLTPKGSLAEIEGDPHPLRKVAQNVWLGSLKRNHAVK